MDPLFATTVCHAPSILAELQEFGDGCGAQERLHRHGAIFEGDGPCLSARDYPFASNNFSKIPSWGYVTAEDV